MAATIETRVWMALRQRVTSIPGGYPIAWPATEFNPANAAYVAVTNFVNRPSRLTIGSAGADDRRGILQLMLCVPVASKLAYEVMNQKASEIAAHFSKDTALTFDGVHVRVTEAPTVAAPMREDNYWQWPVSIRWQAYA